MNIADEKRQRDKAVRKAIYGEIYIKGEKGVQFTDLSNVKMNINGELITLGEYIDEITYINNSLVGDIELHQKTIKRLEGEFDAFKQEVEDTREDIIKDAVDKAIERIVFESHKAGVKI